jgi:hypothetical protein
VGRGEVSDTDARLWHPRLRINRVLRAMLTTRWSAEAWPQVKAEFTKALALRSQHAPRTPRVPASRMSPGSTRSIAHARASKARAEGTKRARTSSAQAPERSGETRGKCPEKARSRSGHALVASWLRISVIVITQIARS